MSQVWSENPLALIKILGTSLSTGLTVQQLELLKSKYGPNVVSENEKVSQIGLLLRQLQNPMVYTLTAAAGIAAVLGERIDAVAILAIVLLNAGIGYFQESKAEAAIWALKKLTVPKARALRDGKIQTVDSMDIFPGDILILEAGDYIVADARIIEAYQLKANESILTGESLPVEKNPEVVDEKAELAERRNMLFAGTAVASGSGRAVVVSTAMETQLGKIAGLLSKTEIQQTPMQERLKKVGDRLLLLGGVVIFIVVLIGLFQDQPLFTIFMTGISLAVAAIPEGLPTVVTLALALSVRRMVKRHALVRNLSAVETLGSTDVICTDKTGTLTTGKMQVLEVFTLDGGLKDADTFRGHEFFYYDLILCNNASLDMGGSGDTTELAILMLAEEHGMNIHKVRNRFQRIHEWSFDSDRKRMSVAVEDGEMVRIFSKGAPESILTCCVLSESQYDQIEKEVSDLSSKGRRILALAHKEVSKAGITTKTDSEIEKDLSFLALVALADPPKEETISSIAACRAAGIKVVMITGDHPITANAIARELGITIGGEFDKVLTGKELNELSASQHLEQVESISVYARVNPEHKLRIIEALQSKGHVVAMTGDGVNDAPALKRASIGVAMGKGGTEVARQASSMILTDDNFSTIVAAVEEGRGIFGNIKRTVQYLLSTNLAEILIMLGAVLLGLPVPLTPLGLLWINLITDGLPSLALASEPIRKNLLRSSQGPSPESFFDFSFMRELFYVALIMTAIELYVYSYMLKTSDLLSARSYAFTLLVYLSLFRSFSCRSETKTFFELPFNYWHLASVLLPIGIQTVLQMTETFESLFNVRTLSLQENILLFFLGLIPVTVVEVIKLWRRK